MLICNDRKISEYTRAVSRQWLGKHFPTATDTNAAVVQQQRKVFSMVRAEAVVKQLCAKHISAATNPDTIIEELCFLLVRAKEL
jgi:hypothetical protein